MKRKFSSALPPLKRDWKPGAWQLGLFIRFPDGAVYEASLNDSPKNCVKTAMELMLRLLNSLWELSAHDASVNDASVNEAPMNDASVNDASGKQVTFSGA